MFPRFDNLTDSEFEHNRNLLAEMSVADPDQAMRCLNRIANAFRQSTQPEGTASAAKSGPIDALSPPLRQVDPSVPQPSVTQPSAAKHIDGEPQWYQSLKRILQQAPSPDAILESIDHYLNRSRDVAAAFALFEETPRAFEILARLSCSSSFLTQILVNDPQALASLASERRTAEMKSREDFGDSAFAAIAAHPADFPSMGQKLDCLRTFQRLSLIHI